MAHLLGYLAGFDMSDSPFIKAMANNPELLTARARKMFFQWIAQLCDASLTLIIFQDIHLADPGTLDLINEIITDDAQKRLMVVNVARLSLYDFRPHWGSGLAFHTRLNLHPLDKRDSQTLLRTILQKVADLPKQFVDTLVERSEGIPFYLEELVKKLLDDRVIIKDSERVWRLEAQRLEYIDVPSTLVGLLQARIDSLLYPEKLVLQRAAVLGNIFYDDAIMALDQVDENRISDLPVTLTNLVKGGFLYLRERSDFDDCQEFTFASKMVQDVTLNSLIRSMKETYNLAAAKWYISLSGERVEEFSSQIAQYFSLGGDIDNTIEWYLRAAAYAQGRALPVEARIYYENALEWIPPQNWEQLWTANLGHNEVLGILGEVKLRNLSDNALLRIAEELKDQGKLAVAHHHSAYTSILLGNPQDALSALRLSLQAIQNTGDQVIKSLVLSLMIVCYTQLGELNHAEAILEDALGSLSNCQDEKVLVRCLHNISIYYAAVGDYGRAIQLLEKHIEIDKKLGDVIGQARGLGHIGYNYILLGQHDNGRLALEQSLHLTNKIDTHQKRAYDLLNLGLAHWRCTNYDLALDVLGEGQGYLLDQGDAFGGAVAQTYLGLVFESMGETTRSKESFSKANEALIKIGAAAYSIDAKAGIVRCLLNQGKHNEAYALAVEIWDFIEPSQGMGLEMPFLAYLACSRAFEKTAQLEKSQEILESGYHVLMQRAAQISDQDWRTSFLENVPEHKELIKRRNVAS
jgi:predicted ATPase